MRHAAIALLGLGLAGCAASPDRPPASIRVATYNVALNDERAGGMIARLEAGDDAARAVASVIRRVRPDVLLLNELDFDPAGRAADLFQQRYLEAAGGDTDPIRYPYRYLAPVNTGVPSGLDLDGDGLVDLIESVSDHFYARMNAGPPSFTFGPAMDTGVADSSKDCLTTVRAGDFDANGRGDLIVPGPAPGCTPRQIIAIDDAGVLAGSPTDLSPGGSAPDGTPFLEQADLNGDQLRDFVSVVGADPFVRWNTGAGFAPAVPLIGGPYAVDETRVLDVNGDGREDILAITPAAGDPTMHDTRLYVSMANGVPGGVQFFQLQLNAAPAPGAHASAVTGDFDGDGAAEVAELLPSATQGWASGGSLVVRDFALPVDLDRLVAVRDEGASHARDVFVYARAWSDAPEAQTCVYPQHCIRHGMTVVREHWTSQGERLLPAYQKTLYSYEGPRTDMRGRGFLGFAKVRSWVPGLFRERVTTYDNVTRVEMAVPAHLQQAIKPMS